jgi:hemolysin activation/secretion protein
MKSASLVRVIFLATLALGLASLWSAGFANPKPASTDGPSYTVDSIVLEYDRDTPGVPSVKELMDLEIRLGESDEGFVASREDTENVTLKLREIQQLDGNRFSASAIRAINQKIVDEFNRRGFVDVYVAPASGQFTQEGKDLRPSDARELRLSMRFGHVVDVRTKTYGERFGTDAEDNNPAHERIRRNSPIGPSEETDPRLEVIRKDLLDDYLFRLNRHPGRRVDATLAPSGAGGVSLDYVVTENKEWLTYSQFSNTGTEDTQEWRQRFGFVNHQLTDRDDILSLDYITAGFSDLHAGIASYEAPLFDFFNTRWKASGYYSEFTSSDVAAFGTDFVGEEWSLGADVYHNFFQRRELFVDWYAGARFRDITADNVSLGGDGNDTFFLPHLGVRLERNKDTVNSTAFVEFEMNVSSIGGSSSDASEKLGRTDPEVDWGTVKWNVTHSFYLEPLLNRVGFEDAETPSSSTLAHEISLGFKGQYAFDYRLIPHAQYTVGGLYTVRGYEESLVAGDSTIVGSVEYRLHIPRLLNPRAPQKKVFGKPFKVARDSVYGRPDWDLVAKAFFDFGTTLLNDEVATEDEQTLVGAGLGVEFLFRRNLSFRADFGFALEDVDTRVSAGDSEVHFAATFLF